MFRCFAKGNTKLTQIAQSSCKIKGNNKERLLSRKVLFVSSGLIVFCGEKALG